MDGPEIVDKLTDILDVLVRMETRQIRATEMLERIAKELRPLE